MTQSSHKLTACGGSMASRVLLYAGFAATGVSLALPGSLMPWLLARWSMPDARAGELFFLFFIGTTTGALLSRGNLRWSVFRGALCTSCGAALLAISSRPGAFLSILLLGVGLGVTMTSISLVQSRKNSSDCAAELTRLNLFWAVGACTAPWLLLHAGVLDGVHAKHALLALAVFFAAVAVCVPAIEDARPEHASVIQGTNTPLFDAPLPLLLLVFCSTGVESSCGGWLATYSQRGGHSLGATIGAPTLFWMGLLVSRSLHSSARFGKAAKPFLLSWNLLAMAAAIALLIAARGGSSMLIACFVIGFASGPMYPLLLAMVFEHVSGNMIFVVAGVGSAVLPLLTGALSSLSGSLRAGLAIPCAAAGAMCLAGWSLRVAAARSLAPPGLASSASTVS